MPSTFHVLVLFLISLAGSVIVLKLVLSRAIYREPETSPRLFAQRSRSGNKKMVACVGDSLTQGTASYNYVTDLSHRQRLEAFEFINAGSNGDLAYTLSRRLDEIVVCNPDYITLLVGTNDITAVLDEKGRQHHVRQGRIPSSYTPSLDMFKKVYESIIDKFLAETNAKIALISLPLIGEFLDDEANLVVAEYSKAIQTLAAQKNLVYLPLYEKQVAFLKQHENISPRTDRSNRRWLSRIAVFKRYLLGRDWNSIAKDNGFLLSVDFLHQSETGGRMIADLIEKFLLNHVEQVPDR